MPVLFVLLPSPHAIEPLLAAAANPAALRLRRYPQAHDAAHLRSLVRAGRDPLATTWWRGALRATAVGAALGGLTNGMLGGLLALAVPLGVGIGAFLGGFAAAMTGTEVPRDALQPLLARTRRGDQLLQLSTNERAALAQLAAHCATAQCEHVLLD